jgi:hypothetical protein
MKTNKIDREAKLLIQRIEELMAEQDKLNRSFYIKRGIAAKKAKLLNSQVKKS